MNKFKKIIAAPHFSTGALVLAAVLLLFSSVGGIRAALVEQSNYYEGEVDLSSIGVTLMEKNAGHEEGHAVAHRNWSEGLSNTEDDYIKWDVTPEEERVLLDGMIPKNDDDSVPPITLGKAYQEELSVKNSGSIDEYVRVSVYKYWLDEKGKKDRSMDPSLIDLKFETGSWAIDTKSSTDERTVLYYKKVLPVGEETDKFTSTLSIDRKVGAIVDKTITETRTEGDTTYTTFTTLYTYDGKQFCVEAIVDAVQDHHAKEAIKSAWGVDATISGSSVSYTF